MVGIDRDVYPPFGPKTISSYVTVNGMNLNGTYGASFCMVSNNYLFTQNLTSPQVSTPIPSFHNTTQYTPLTAF